MTCVEGKGQLALSECTKFIGDQDIPTGGQQQLERRAGLHFSGLWGGINRFYFDSERNIILCGGSICYCTEGISCAPLTQQFGKLARRYWRGSRC